jgi:hypothetical protein
MKSWMWLAVVFGGVGIPPVVGAQAVKDAPLKVEAASVGADGMIRLRWSGQPERVIPRDRNGYCEDKKHCEDAGADQLAVSSNGQSVGWTAGYNGCCQSYPIPMVLVIARNGRVVKRIQRERPIWQWQFEDGDAKVAVFTDTTHSNLMPECALYDTRTWKVIDEWHRGKSATLPEWAKPFADAVGETTDGNPSTAAPPR